MPKDKRTPSEHTPVAVLLPDAPDDGWLAWKRLSGMWRDAVETDSAEKNDKYLNE